MVVPQGPGSHASSPFDGQLWQSLPRSQDLASLAVYICYQAWLSLLPWEERSVPMLCANRPAADWLQGLEAEQVLAGQLMSKCHWWLNVYLCPFHYKKPHLWPSHPHPLTIQLLSSETALSESSSGGCRQLPVLGASPGSLPRLGEELPPANSSGGCFSWSARVSNQDRFLLSSTLRRCSWSHSPAVKWAQGGNLMR